MHPSGCTTCDQDRYESHPGHASDERHVDVSFAEAAVDDLLNRDWDDHPTRRSHDGDQDGADEAASELRRQGEAVFDGVEGATPGAIGCRRGDDGHAGSFS
jgi:hypothetical protein